MPTAYVTAPPDAADRLARSLVEDRLAACVNRVPCHSVFRWEGDVETEPEAILLAKTTADRYPALVDAVEDRHPYDVPCVERFDEADLTDAFGAWVAGSVQGTG
jgi:periplasmic divalent cation tolerance protein